MLPSRREFTVLLKRMEEAVGVCVVAEQSLVLANHHGVHCTDGLRIVVHVVQHLHDLLLVWHGDAEAEEVSTVLLGHPLDDRTRLHSPRLELGIDAFEIEGSLLKRWRCGVADGIADDADALGGQKTLRVLLDVNKGVPNRFVVRQAHHERNGTPVRPVRFKRNDRTPTPLLVPVSLSKGQFKLVSISAARGGSIALYLITGSVYGNRS